MSAVVAEAPMAMPSAAAWMTSPVVVARLRDCFGVGVREPRKDSVSSLVEEVARSSRLICRVVGAVWNWSVACRGRRSTRNMRAKPRIRAKPM